MRTEHEKVLDILFEKKVDIDDLIESENYDNFRGLTEEYYDKYTNKKVNKREWLKYWSLTEEEYCFLRRYYEEHYGD